MIISQESRCFKQSQHGFSSLIFILLVGLSLTVFTVGYMASMKNLQTSAITTHAQTQAQMNAMIGYQALSEFLKQDQLDINEINSISTGTVTSDLNEVIQYRRSTSCPTGTGNYCFDIIGSSGGVKAVLTSLFSITTEIKSESVAGTIFAGGLVVGGNANFVGESGEPVKIFVGGENAGTVVDTAGKEVDLSGKNIEVNEYLGGLTVADATSLRKDANYIFTKNSSGVMTCYKNNINVSGVDITSETLITCPTGVSVGNKNNWVFNGHLANLSGILWFDSDVLVQLKNEPNDLVNTILSVGSITSDLLDGKGIYNAYSPYQYLFTATDSNILSRLNKVCPQNNYPIQYCKSYNSTDRALITTMSYFVANKNTFLKDLEVYPASLSNILFLTDTGFALDAANDTTLNFYGNIIGTQGAGGTGMASGKITGTGDINIRGNIVVTGTLETEVQGNMTVTLGKSSDGGNSVPVVVKTTTPKAISYQ
jgi:hypothetical protein